MASRVPVGVVETPDFLAAARRIMTDEERGAVVDYLAYNPRAGDLVPGTGGVRKLRWGLEGRGKRGGARIIHHYHGDAMPLFALAAYAKNRRSDLSADDRNGFRRLTALLAQSYLGRMQ